MIIQKVGPPHSQEMGRGYQPPSWQQVNRQPSMIITMMGICDGDMYDEEVNCDCGLLLPSVVLFHHNSRAILNLRII